MDTNRQTLVNERPAPRAALGCVSGVNQCYASTSIFCFIGDELHQLKPRSIRDRFSQTVVTEHPLTVQLFKGDYTVFVDQFTAEFMSKVLTPVGYTIVNMRHGLTPTRSLGRSLFSFAQFTLSFSQRLLILSKEALVCYLLAGRESSKALEPDIDTDRFLGRRQWRKLYFAGKASIPFTGAVSPQGEGFNLALEWAMDNGLKLAYLSSHDCPVLERKPKLGIGQAAVSALTPETRIARLLSCLRTPKERFKREVDALLGVLQYLRVDHRQTRAFQLPLRKKGVSGIQADRLLLLLPGVLTKGERLVEYPTTLLKHLVQNTDLFRSRIYTILKRFTHINTILQPNANYKKGCLAHSYPAINCGAF